MADIELIVPATQTRRWQALAVDALIADGHDVSVVYADRDDHWPAAIDLLLRAEAFASRGRLRMHDRCAVTPRPALDGGPRHTVDLSGGGAGFSVTFDGSPSAAEAASALIRGRLPELAIAGPAGVLLAAQPMVDSRVVIGKGLDDVLARAVTLLRAFTSDIDRHAVAAPRIPSFRDRAPAGRGGGGVVRDIATGLLPRLGREIVRRSRYQQAHWRVGYRFHDGAGAGEIGLLSGEAWHELPDDGARYYADPFPFEHRGRHYLFVEEFPHATGKGIISVAEFDAHGRPSVPRPVLELPFHLSYPQIFAHGGEIYMLPEGGAGGELVLYRAASFPDRWERDCVLLPGLELYDATLLEKDGRFWLFAATRDGRGSSSDTAVAFHAPALKGPWTPHRRNPLAIDLAAARPGGAFMQVGRRVVRPVQDGTTGYGGGLGLSDLIRLDEDEVVFSRPVPILGARQWPYPRIHTLNRAGRLEVIDGIAEMPRRARAA